MVTDPVADMLTRLKNAAMAGLASTTIPFSGFKWQIAELLKKEGYLQSISRKGRAVRKYIVLNLAYEDKKPKLAEVKRVSKLSRRIYHGVAEIRPVRQGYGLAVYSTPRGLLTDKDARRARVGGELLFKIW